MLVGYILPRVCIRCCQFSRLPSLLSSLYVGLYVFNWPIQVRWSRGYIYNSSYRNEIGSINLYHCCHISVVLHQKWLYHHMLSISYINRKTEFSYILSIISHIIWANNQTHHGPMIVFVCLCFTLLHYHHHSDVSEGIELLKCLLGVFSRVCVKD